METRAESQNVGLFDERYLAFLKTAADIRASLHRYCSRMTGSIMDGEDLVQDTLFQAYQKISMFDASRPLNRGCSALLIISASTSCVAAASARWRKQRHSDRAPSLRASRLAGTSTSRSN